MKKTFSQPRCTTRLGSLNGRRLVLSPPVSHSVAPPSLLPLIITAYAPIFDPRTLCSASPYSTLNFSMMKAQHAPYSPYSLLASRVLSGPSSPSSSDELYFPVATSLDTDFDGITKIEYRIWYSNGAALRSGYGTSPVVIRKPSKRSTPHNKERW